MRQRAKTVPLRHEGMPIKRHEDSVSDGVPDTIVVPDPDATCLPTGCITSKALRTLANAIDKLEDIHIAAGGFATDHPCLRRIESSAGEITAHVATGPAVGGSWVRLYLRDGKWHLSPAEDDDT